MALTLLFTGFSSWIPPVSPSSFSSSSPSDSFSAAETQETSTARIACIALGIYLFGAVYSPGAGPVPFTYSAEAYPLYVRTLGMSVATATTWFFNAVLSITWPSLQARLGNPGAFGWYAAWNVGGWWAVLLLMPVSLKLFYVLTISYVYVLESILSFLVA